MYACPWVCAYTKPFAGWMPNARLENRLDVLKIVGVSLARLFQKRLEHLNRRAGAAVRCVGVGVVGVEPSEQEGLAARGVWVGRRVL
eukprot:scaffold20083_cov101-Isochrysis_galbana.AAC.1